MTCNESSYQKCVKDVSYEDAISYWTNIPPTVNGMLGGFGFISSIDIKASEQFLRALFKNQDRLQRLNENLMKNRPGNEKALDCGAGIGRITKHLLLHFFNKVDLVEPIKAFIEESRSYIQNDAKIGDLYNVGLQDFKPCTKYDVIWCQWVLSHLTNPHLVNFFQSCRENLKPNGVIVVKENLSSSEEGDLDETDSSRTRHESEMKQLFISGGLRIVKESVQKKFPTGLYCVKMYALRPNDSVIVKNL